MSRFGAPETMVRAQQSFQEGKDLVVLQANMPIVEFFYSARTQWRMVTAGAAGMGGAVLRPEMIGLDYAGLAALARALRFKLDPEAMRRLQLMEIAALAEFTRGQA